MLLTTYTLHTDTLTKLFSHATNSRDMEKIRRLTSVKVDLVWFKTILNE